MHGNDNGKEVQIDIDLVPSFLFTKDQIPFQLDDKKLSLFAQKSKEKFFIVPKSRYNESVEENASHLWQLSFQEQEKELISNRNNLKPAVKFLKVLIWKNIIHLVIFVYNIPEITR